VSASRKIRIDPFAAFAPVLRALPTPRAFRSMTLSAVCSARVLVLSGLWLSTTMVSIVPLKCWFMTLFRQPSIVSSSQ